MQHSTLRDVNERAWICMSLLPVSHIWHWDEDGVSVLGNSAVGPFLVLINVFAEFCGWTSGGKESVVSFPSVSYNLL